MDCFYEGENMLVIHPDECIDCGVCEPECPVDAIKPDTELGLEKWLSLNAEYAKIWPNITAKKPPPPDRSFVPRGWVVSVMWSRKSAKIVSSRPIVGCTDRNFCAVGNTARDTSGSNPSRSATIFVVEIT